MDDHRIFNRLRDATGAEGDSQYLRAPEAEIRRDEFVMVERGEGPVMGTDAAEETVEASGRGGVQWVGGVVRPFHNRLIS